MNLLTLLTIYNGNKTKVLNEVKLMADVSLKLSAKDIYEKDFEKRWLAVIVGRS